MDWAAIKTLGILGCAFALIFIAPQISEFLKAKIYHAGGRRVWFEGDTVVRKITLWSIVLSGAGFIPLALGAAAMIIDVTIGLIIFLFPIVMGLFVMLVRNETILDDKGITINFSTKKSVFIFWKEVSMVTYEFWGRRNYVKKYFVFHANKVTYAKWWEPENGMPILDLQTSFMETLEYAVTKIPQQKFNSDAQKKLKKLGITFPEPSPPAASIRIAPVVKTTFSGYTGQTSFTIPNGTTVIEEKAFEGCVNLTSITIPNSVTSIGPSAFEGCTGLTSLTIPNSVTELEHGAFFGCSGLTSVTLPNGITKIEDDMFFGCVGLMSITIPGSVTEIGECAFMDCKGLTSITIPCSVTEIDIDAFSGCAGLTSVIIPSGVSKIGGGIFSDCAALMSIEVAADNLDYCSALGVLFNRDMTVLMQYPAGIHGAYTIPSCVVEIGDSSFYGCVGLTSVTIPNSVVSIGEYAFYGCEKLTSITIPRNVKNIQCSAFQDCAGLTSITVQKSYPPKAGNDAFSGINMSKASLCVPANSINSYRRAGGWKDFQYIKAI